LGKQTFQTDRWKLALSIFWFVFTFSMVTWWWIFALGQLENLSLGLAPEKFQSFRRMLLWEGSILLTFIFAGGAALLILTNRERLRNLRLRLFFSNFSHDLKTSLGRLRLRTEILAQKAPSSDLQKLMDEVSRLDLQLENSLWVSKGEEQSLLVQEISLHQLISRLRPEWPDVEIHLRENAILRGDPQALQSVLRNLLQNARFHGQASRIEISAETGGDKRLSLTVQDNGTGFSGRHENLGREMLPQDGGKGNGIGLYLTRSLLQRMQSEISFPPSPKGFQARLEIPGRLETIE
jgi:signal transduction histidine kinase